MKAIFLSIWFLTLFTGVSVAVFGSRHERKTKRDLRDAEELERRICLYEKQMRALDAMGETWCCHDRKTTSRPNLRIVK